MIKTSRHTKEIVSTLTRKLGLGYENHISRIAFGYSISQGEKLNIQDILDSSGKEYSDSVFFGDKQDAYKGMVSTFYNLHPDNPDVMKLIKMHVDDGLMKLHSLYDEKPNLDVFVDLIDSY